MGPMCFHQTRDLDPQNGWLLSQKHCYFSPCSVMVQQSSAVVAWPMWEKSYMETTTQTAGCLNCTKSVVQRFHVVCRNWFIVTETTRTVCVLTQKGAPFYPICVGVVEAHLQHATMCPTILHPGAQGPMQSKPMPNWSRANQCGRMGVCVWQSSCSCLSQLHQVWRPNKHNTGTHTHTRTHTHIHGLRFQRGAIGC